MLSDYITSTPGICGGKPCIRGRRIRVQDVAIFSEEMQQNPDQIAQEFDLTLAQVHAALAYYFEHIDAIRAEIRREREEFVRLKAENPSKLGSA